jgi:hypothetical protein
MITWQPSNPTAVRPFREARSDNGTFNKREPGPNWFANNYQTELAAYHHALKSDTDPAEQDAEARAIVAWLDAGECE